MSCVQTPPMPSASHPRSQLKFAAAGAAPKPTATAVGAGGRGRRARDAAQPLRLRPCALQLARRTAAGARTGWRRRCANRARSGSLAELPFALPGACQLGARVPHEHFSDGTVMVPLPTICISFCACLMIRCIDSWSLQVRLAALRIDLPRDSHSAERFSLRCDGGRVIFPAAPAAVDAMRPDMEAVPDVSGMESGVAHGPGLGLGPSTWLAHANGRAEWLEAVAEAAAAAGEEGGEQDEGGVGTGPTVADPVATHPAEAGSRMHGAGLAAATNGTGALPCMPMGRKGFHCSNHKQTNVN